eukprot:5814247-Prymnesium_polylepis.1
MVSGSQTRLSRLNPGPTGGAKSLARPLVLAYSHCSTVRDGAIEIGSGRAVGPIWSDRNRVREGGWSNF